MNEWNIQSRAHACQACGKAFVDRQAYHTLLLDNHPELVRADVCPACWESQHAGARDRKGFISQWQGVYEAPPAAPPETVKRETAETLLRQIIERNEKQYAAAAFILAAMLERKRILRVKEQGRRDGQRYFLYEHPKTGDLITIVDPNLQLNDIVQVQRDVAHLLEHGLPALPNPVEEPFVHERTPGEAPPAATPETEGAESQASEPEPESSPDAVPETGTTLEAGDAPAAAADPADPAPDSAPAPGPTAEDRQPA